MNTKKANRLKRGYVREDGMVFWSYQSDGREYWVTPKKREDLHRKSMETNKRILANNPERKAEYIKRWLEKHKNRIANDAEFREKINKRGRDRLNRGDNRRIHAEKMRQKYAASKQYREKNLDRNRRYRAREEVKIKVSEATKIRRKEDILYAMKVRLRAATARAFRNLSAEKKHTTLEMLGVETFEQAVSHIENLFTEGMSWENMGKWHIDHITPLASASSVHHLKMLCNYKNLQPLWARDNLSKGARIAPLTNNNL